MHIATCEHDGGALRAQSAVYKPDGTKLDVHFRKLAQAPAEQLPASKQ